VTVDGYRRLSEEEVGAIVDSVMAARMQNPGGPPAPLR
jgi:proteasome beta subunit